MRQNLELDIANLKEKVIPLALEKTESTFADRVKQESGKSESGELAQSFACDKCLHSFDH